MNFSTEPARLVGLATAAVIALGTFFTMWGGGVDWRVALGTALGGAAIPAAGGEVVRSRVYSPATADRIMDADRVISAGELDGHA